MNALTPRRFEATEAKREKVPLLVSLFGPSGSGKTYSALRLATGMQSVTGGDIYVVDTEAKRAKHYADSFKFKHIEFGAPFGSLDYLDALKWCVDQGARTIVVDSGSHEHEGVGGYLMTHAAEMERMGNNDKNKFTAWIKPAQQRRQMINGMLQLNANFIFCFRAKEKLKIGPGGRPSPMGWMPIAGDEFLFEMTLSALLEPASNGVPTWQPSEEGSRSMVKIPQQFRHLDELDQPLGENLGRLLATWSEGGNIMPAAKAGAVTPEEWANKQGALIKAMTDEDEFTSWLAKNSKALGALKLKDPGVYEILNDIVTATRTKLMGAEG